MSIFREKNILRNTVSILGGLEGRERPAALPICLASLHGDLHMDQPCSLSLAKGLNPSALVLPGPARGKPTWRSRKLHISTGTAQQRGCVLVYHTGMVAGIDHSQHASTYS